MTRPAGCGFNGHVRRLPGWPAAVCLAALVIALFVAALAPLSLPLVPERPSPSTHDDGVGATPVHAAAADLTVAPAGAPTPSTTANRCLFVSFLLQSSRFVTERSSGLPATVRASPAVLRV